jgi:carboxyl-terminal processing protease
MQRIRLIAFILVFLFPFAVLCAGNPTQQQGIQKLDLDRASGMLRDAYDNVKRFYYDPKFHGLDWEARYLEYQQKMQTVGSLSQGFGTVADFLEALHDSHTYFVPPSRPVRIDYGFRMELVGDSAFVTRVRPETDAVNKMHPGDQIISINRAPLNRESYFTVNYYFNRLAPQMGLQLALRDPSGQTRALPVTSKMQTEKKLVDLTGSDGGVDIFKLIRDEENADHVVRQRYIETGDVMIWKMPEFYLENHEVDHLFDIARRHKVLILDLRENGGGLEDTLTRMVANLFDHDAKIADRIARKEEKPALAKTRGNNVFTGKIIVLVDSASASASELFARVVQLENRGVVIGDRSYGRVMEAKGYDCAQGVDTKVFYSFSITHADLIMKDGKSIEHVGVTPDETILPTAQDIAAGRDPVLSRALEIAGVKVDPAAAGKMFPFEWVPF